MSKSKTPIYHIHEVTATWAASRKKFVALNEWMESVPHARGDEPINNPLRTQDLEDIRALLRAQRATLGMAEVREYFRLFDREPLLDELLHQTD